MIAANNNAQNRVLNVSAIPPEVFLLAAMVLAFIGVLRLRYMAL